MKKYQNVCIQSLITFAFCFLMVCQFPAMAQSQDESRRGALPNQILDSRSLSMAGTTIADLYGRPSIGINSALSGLFDNPNTIQFNSNYNWDTNRMLHDLTLPTFYSDNHHITARFGLLHKGFDNLPFTNPSSATVADLTMFRGEFAYSYAISNHFSLGTLQSVSYTMGGEEAQFWNYFADVGLVYAPDGPVSYGLVFRGLGHKTTYEIIETGQTTLDSRLARQIIEIGATFRFPIEERTWLSISFANEKRFGEDGSWYKGSFEIIPFSFIEVRAGAMVNFDQLLFIPRIGLGINVGEFRIDYMVAPEKLIGEQFHQIGLTYQL